jgi:DNA-binding beta-propeller fold protein YncE
MSLQSYPSSKTYNALLYDKHRDLLYVSMDSQIARFSPSSSTFLTSITPPSITGQNQFQAMSLTPDGSRLIVANKQDISVAIIDPDNPSNAQAIAIPAVSPNPGGPVFVAATAIGKALISIGGFSYPWTGPLFELDLATSQVQSITIPGTIPRDSMGLYPTSDGKTVFVRTYGGFAGFWDPATGQFSGANDNLAGAGLGAAAGDGNVFAVGVGFLAPDGSSLVGWGIPDELGGFQGFFSNQAALNDSGSLEFVANSNKLFIFDTHHGDLLRSLTLPSQVNTWTRAIALDPTAAHVYISDLQGLTVLTLASPPLALGSVTPSIASVSGGTILSLRGSGFDPTTTVDIGGKMATTVFVDASTLQVTAPANSVGPTQMTLRKPGGERYQLDSALVYQ